MNALEKLNAYEKQRQGRGNDTENRATRQTNIQRGTRRSDVSRNQRTEEQSHLANGATHTTIPDDVSANLYNELLLTQELMTVLPQMEAKYHSQVAKELRDAQSEREAEEQPREREKQLNYLKTQAMELEQSTISDQLEPQKKNNHP